MAQRNTFLLLGLILTVLLLGVAYAALENITLNINGTVQATPDQASFKVTFIGSPSFTGDGSATLQLTSETTATMNVYGLSVLGDKLTATFSIKNSSSDLSASLSGEVTNINKEYFKITPVLATTDLEPGETTNLKVSVELIKTPITTQTDSIQVNIVASPYQAGTIGGNSIIDGDNVACESCGGTIQSREYEMGNDGEHVFGAYCVNCGAMIGRK